MWIKILLFFTIFFFYFSANSQIDEARRIVQTLCSDSLSGRGYVSNGVHKAADFIVKEFKNIGVQPYFGDTSYIQNYSFDVNTFPGKMSIKTPDKVLKPGIDYLVNEYSGSYKGELTLLEIDSSYFKDESSLLDLMEQIEHGVVNGFYVDLTLYQLSQRRNYQQLFNNLASIAPIIYITDQKFTWSVAREQIRFPIISIQKDIIAPDIPLEVEIEAEVIPNFPSQNIVGYIPSKKRNPKKAKTIVFTAHYDHLGAMGTIPEKTIFPGGNDNASGTSMLFSLANYFKENPTKYNIVFIAFSGEEAGLLGSKYFVESNAMDLSKIHFLINLDIMGSGEDGITAVNGTIFKKEFNLLVKINQKENYLTTINSRGEAQNSDHWFFYKAGVPSIFIYTMGPNKNYHDVYDTYEELSFSAYENIVQLLIDFVKKI